MKIEKPKALVHSRIVKPEGEYLWKEEQIDKLFIEIRELETKEVQQQNTILEWTEESQETWRKLDKVKDELGTVMLSFDSNVILIDDLKEQIDSMKNCGNCASELMTINEPICGSCYRSRIVRLKCMTKDNWKIK